MTRLATVALLTLVALTGCSDDPLSPLPAYPQRFAVVAAGYEHTCATSTAGDTYCWGNRSLGRLGHPGTDDDCTESGCTRPVGMYESMPFESLGAGEWHTCGLVDARAYCWGYNRFGQLGDNGDIVTRCADDAPFTCTMFPRLVGIGSPIDILTTSRAVACAVTSNGNALCWGWNLAGALGRGFKGDRGFADPQSLSELRFVDLETGFGHTCGLTASGDAYCWGSNEVGRLGTGDIEDRLLPELVQGGLSFTSITTGGSFTCAITTAREIYCWGWGWEGRTGTGNMEDQLSPAPNLMPEPATAVSGGQHHACAIAESGNLYCWGANHNGQLGVPVAGYATTPQLVPLPAPVVRVATGFLHTCAITSDDRLYCWGANAHGQLGVGDFALRTEPTLVNP